jgi:PIN domain nuclease of toxin-antitoxin system
VIILDTHVWIWWVSEPDTLSGKALAAINYARAIGIAPIRCWEIDTKVAQGKLTLDRPLRVWVRQALARPGVILMELSAEIAIRAGELGQ